jgi:hypothetical protein
VSADIKPPAFKAQFEEIARLEAALRSGELAGQAAADALRRLYDLMDWQDETNTAQVDYLIA